MKPDYIIGVDPGTESTGVAVYAPGDLRASICANGNVADRNFIFGNKFPVVIERIGHYGTGMSVGREVFDTCVWTGRFIESFLRHGRQVFWISRPTIKAHLCGSAKAKDPNVRQALIDRLGPQGTKKNPGPTYGISSHMWSALAVAVVAHDLWGELEEVV